MLRVESIAGQVREWGLFQLQPRTPRTIYSRTNKEYKENKGMKKRNRNKKIMMMAKYKNKTKNES